MNDPIDTRVTLTAVILTTAISLAISLISLSSGVQIIFQNLFYIPIVLACIFFTRRGLYFSILLALLYLSLILSIAGPEHLVNGLIRVVFFILVALVVTILAEKDQFTSRELQMTNAVLLNTNEKLLETGEYLEKLITHANAPIIVWDRDGHITRFNRSMEDVSGISAEEAVGSDFRIIFSLDQHCIDLIHAAVKGEATDQIEIPILQRGGEKRTILWSFTDIMANDRESVIATIAQGQEITGRKAAEEQLRESEEYYRDIIDNANELVQSVNPDGRFIFVNQTWRDTLGYSDEEIKSLTLFDIIHPDSLDHCIATFQQVMTGKAVSNVQAVFLTKEGEKVPVEGNVNCRTVHGVTNTRGIFHNISEQKRSKEALQLSNKKLQLLTGITRHDILNEVMVLLGNLGFAEEIVSDPELKGYLERVKRAGTTIQKQIEFTRLYDGLGSTEPAWQHLGRTIRSSCRNSLPIRISSGDLFIFSDPMLGKVFSNLMDNTIRHGEDATAVTVTCRKDSDGGIVIIWEDDGIGIPDDQKKKIFARGFGKHTGFGLFLSQEILAITQIEIQETGVYGKGARFEMKVQRGGWRLESDQKASEGAKSPQ